MEKVSVAMKTLEDSSLAVKALLEDLDTLCKKLEVYGHETLIFCSAADGVISSQYASLFFKPVDRVYLKFKEFCEKQKLIAKETAEIEHRTVATDESLGDTTVLNNSEVYDEDAFDDLANLQIIEIDFESKENDQSFVSPTETFVETVEGNDKPVQNKRYLETDKKGTVIKRKKLDGTDIDTENETLKPVAIVTSQASNNVKGCQTPKIKRYLTLDDEKFLLVTPEEAGLDFSLEEGMIIDCFKCEKQYSHASRFREHLTKSHKIKVGHQCVCGRLFSDSTAYQKHLDNKLYQNYHHECKECNGIFPSVTYLQNHMIRIHGDKAADIIASQEVKIGEFLCKKCEKTFQHEQHLIDHNKNLPNCDESVKADDQVEEKMLETKLKYLDKNGKTVETTFKEVLEENTTQPFVCPCCSKTFEVRRNFVRHVQRHIPQGNYLCLICGNKFRGKDGLQRHLHQHTIRPYNCSNCRNKFETQEELDLHIISRCKDGTRKDFQCNLCDYVANSMTALTTHQNMHAGLKLFKCTKCEKSFATKGSLDRHDTVMHKDITPFKCDCGKAFKTRDNLSKHAKIHLEPKYSCEICGKKCHEKGNLNKHMRTHTKEKPYVCESCGKSYSRKALLDNHHRLHTGEKPYKCTKEGCDKAFRSYSNLQQHIRNHSPNHPYMCDICGRKFKQSGRLTHHRKGHSMEQRWSCPYCVESFRSMFLYKSHLAKFHPDMRRDIEEKANIKLYECDICNKVYGDKDDLQRHIYIHQNLKPFSCQYCGKSFNDKSNMKSHEKKIHTGVRNHWCEVCKKGFLHRRDLRKHMKTNHREDDDEDMEKQVREKKPRRRVMVNRDKDTKIEDYNEVQDEGQRLEAHLMTQQFEIQPTNPRPVETDKKELQPSQTMLLQEQVVNQSMMPTLTYIPSHGGVPLANIPMAIVNPATEQIEPLLLVQNINQKNIVL